MTQGRVVLLTGAIGSGKSPLCLEIASQARSDSVSLGGVISPGVFQEGQKVAIDVLDLKTRKRRRLAVLKEESESDLATKRWSFDVGATAWGNRILKEAVPCDLLIVDELGPLEFEKGKGWVEGFRAVDSGRYRAALLTIRPSLLDRALQRWGKAEVIDLERSDLSILMPSIILQEKLLGDMD